MSGSQILADIIPNPTFIAKYDHKKGARVDKPENLWGLSDWRSFLEAVVLCKILQNSTKTQLTTAILSLEAKYAQI